MMVNLRKMRIKSAENSQRTKSSNASSNSNSSSSATISSSDEDKLTQDCKPPTFNISCTDEDLDSQKEDTTEDVTTANFKNER